MLARVMDTNDEWIRERSGIVTRYFVESGVGSAELGVEAATNALTDAAMDAQDVDYIVCATMTPNHYFPGCGTLIQQGLGISPVPALDIRQQCAGFAYGMQIVDALIRAGIAQTVLLVGTDVHTSLMPFGPKTWKVLMGDDPGPLSEEELAWNSKYRHLCVLFGDAAGAMVFKAEAGGDRGILGSRLFGQGKEKGILYVPGAGSSNRPWVDAEMVANGGTVPVMDGRKVFKLAVTRMPRVTKELLKQHDLTLEDVDLLVMHQANLRINEAAQRVLGLADDRVHNNVQRYGNTTSATLPLCFHEARSVGKADPGSLVAFAALGAGLHWGAVLLQT
jgi:3-oxoacyl-[acyl-carrier-protein] synthase-3